MHADQRRTDHTTVPAPGATVTERWESGRAGRPHVPGGTAVYPSSVVMNAVPAQAAGVESWWWPAPAGRLLAAFRTHDDPGGRRAARCRRGVAVGGAQAVALLAYGGVDTDGVLNSRRVDMITGPGNIYVTAAKRICRSQVGI